MAVAPSFAHLRSKMIGSIPGTVRAVEFLFLGPLVLVHLAMVNLMEGGKLSGTITHRSNVNGKEIIRESPLKETKLQGSEISFTVSHPPHVGAGPDVTLNYQAKISGDGIKGKQEGEWSGATIARNWEAKRVKE